MVFDWDNNDSYDWEQYYNEPYPNDDIEYDFQDDYIPDEEELDKIRLKENKFIKNYIKIKTEKDPDKLENFIHYARRSCKFIEAAEVAERLLEMFPNNLRYSLILKSCRLRQKIR